eukprot:TRINITY_DN8823_c0_g1_i3.p3 TRINITY_DN8823_c0_g1~~TRINITY_DN8823_c0_g1_i3.p3  ORF type:complete len:198 (+),score=-24.74 TRINITY_DN8823_c0_g1_i3:811-1404(+)
MGFQYIMRSFKLKISQIKNIFFLYCRSLGQLFVTIFSYNQKWKLIQIKGLNTIFLNVGIQKLFKNFLRKQLGTFVRQTIFQPFLLSIPVLKIINSVLYIFFRCHQEFMCVFIYLKIQIVNSKYYLFKQYDIVNMTFQYQSNPLFNFQKLKFGTLCFRTCFRQLLQPYLFQIFYDFFRFIKISYVYYYLAILYFVYCE